MEKLLELKVNHGGDRERVVVSFVDNGYVVSVEKRPQLLSPDICDYYVLVFEKEQLWMRV